MESDAQEFLAEQLKDPEFKTAFETLQFTPEEVIALVEKLEPILKSDGYFIGMAYNDTTGLAHIIIEKDNS